MKTKPLSFLLLSVIITACSTNTNTLNTNNKKNEISVSESNSQKTFLTKEDLSALDKEYGQFNVKSFTKPYLYSKLKKWQEVAGVNGTGTGGISLTREIEYARLRHPVLFCTVMSENSDIKSYINSLDIIPASSLYIRKYVVIDNAFKTFLDTGCSSVINSGIVSTLAPDDNFSYPFGVAVDSAGNVFVADTGNQKIRKITPLGVVSTLAGGGADGSTSGSNNGSGTAALFKSPTGIAVDLSGNVYVADSTNNKIRKITAAGVVTTLAGGGTDGITSGSTNGPATSARFNNPYGVAVDKDGNVYVADSYNFKIRKITSDGMVSDLAGLGGWASEDGTGAAAGFSYVNGLAVDSGGIVYVADSTNNKIRKITAAGVVTTLAGGGTDGITSGSTNGTGSSALFNTPTGVAVDSTGNVYVADAFNHKFRMITPAGVVTTLAGGGTDGITRGYNDETGTSALFSEPHGVAVDLSGKVYIADTYNFKIRKIK